MTKILPLLKRIATLNGTPRGIALGFSVGAFLSILPTFSLGMFLALFLCKYLKMNPTSTYIGTLVVNPINGTFIYFIDYIVGAMVFPTTIEWQSGINVEFIKKIALQLYSGGIINASIFSIISYFFILNLIHCYRRKKGDKDNN